MKNSKAAKILRDFANQDMKSLDNRVREYTGDINNTEKRIKALNRAADFLDGKEDFSNKKLDEMFDILNDIQDDIAQFSDELNINSDIKVALFLTADEIENVLNGRGFEL